MPYALFINDERISRIFQTKQEVWDHADEAGLVVDAATDDERPVLSRELDKDYTIKPCEGDAAQ